MRHMNLGRLISSVVLVALLSGAAYAAMNSNNVQNTNAGTGTGAISGYNITNISYTYSTTGTTSYIASVTFDATPESGYNNAATSATAWFTGTGQSMQGGIYDCNPPTTVSAATYTNNFVCPGPGGNLAEVANVQALNVTALQ